MLIFFPPSAPCALPLLLLLLPLRHFLLFEVDFAPPLSRLQPFDWSATLFASQHNYPPSFVYVLCVMRLAMMIFFFKFLFMLRRRPRI